MKKFQVCMFFFWVVVFALIALHSFQVNAESLDGVLVEERIVDLPQDQDKWHISIVGGGQHYDLLLRWFAENNSLKSLRRQVHFRSIQEGSPIFNSRYAQNVGELPVVRVQEANGTVVYEASAGSIPYTADGLYGAIADASGNVQGILRPWRHGGRPWLPWRRQMDERCPGPGPCPVPAPCPEPLPPAPPLDDFGPPVFDEESDTGVSAGLAVLFAALSGLLGGGLGFVQQWKTTYPEA